MKNRKWSIKDKYPINSDSIGIEVIGKYKSNQWEVATQAQKDSIKNLVEILKAEYNLNNDDVYEHDDISLQKTRGEAKGLYEKE
ncbi:MAG: N-acetylmuramoyl-L-alanine amidase [Helicobacter bilis]|uniref:peptidoglycan recognition protein family protein n=1 Tax=Helicobacter bilis TaxID=37372 RepID=UPI0026F1C1C8|nr:N-acetylmuramoyl-L-alanine amidase [Helicobacter bilis]MCI7411908.1 N-acetylmuramoyl-L-alanine amidase [Helicobacter bilis]